MELEHEFGQLAKILRGGGQRKFITRTGRSSQSEAIELQDALQMSEQHFDLLPVPA